MKDLFYWDTPVLVKLYTSEPDSPAYRKLIASCREEPVTSFLDRVELYFALRLKEDRGEISAGGSGRLFGEYMRHLSEGRFHEIPGGEDVTNKATEALESCLVSSVGVRLRSLDGLHLGAMISGGITKLVTTDAYMRKAAEKLNIELIDP